VPFTRKEGGLTNKKKVRFGKDRLDAVRFDQVGLG
jgi:hypothetical protein